MGYKVTCNDNNSVSVLKLLSVVRDPNTGELLNIDHFTEQHYNGEIIPDEELAPVLRELYEDGDAHVHSLFTYVDDPGQSKAEREAAEAAAFAAANQDEEEEETNPQVAQANKARQSRENLVKARAAKTQKAQNTEDE